MFVGIDDIVSAVIEFGTEHWIGSGEDAYLDDIFMDNELFIGTPMKLMNRIMELEDDGFVKVSISEISRVA